MSRALAAQPGARFASVDEFAAHLKGAVVRPLGTGAWIPRIGVKASLLAGAAVVALAAAGVVLFANRGRAIDPRRVVVTGFEDLTGDPALASLGHMAADWVTQELARSELRLGHPGARPQRRRGGGAGGREGASPRHCR